MKVAPCSYKAAKYAVEHWHYSQSLPVPPRTMFGVWEHGKFIGTVIFSRGASPELGRQYGLKQVEVCELTRVALNDHDAPVTQVVAAAIKALRKHSPGLRLIVSFADPHYGHHGGIYQAGNWVYSGDTAPGVEYRDRNGKRWHSRQLSKDGVRKQFGVPRKAPKVSDMTAVKTPGKHRYLMPLDRAMRRQVQSLARDYPRAAVQASTETRSSSTAEGQVQPLGTAPLSPSSETTPHAAAAGEHED